MNMDNTENTKESKKIEKTSVSLDGKSILVTGAAGFIGSNLCARLLRDTQGATIVGIDCMTDYNPLELKEYRLRKVEEAAQSSTSRWVFIRGDIADKPLIDDIVEGIIRVMGGTPENLLDYITTIQSLLCPKAVYQKIFYWYSSIDKPPNTVCALRWRY